MVWRIEINNGEWRIHSSSFQIATHFRKRPGTLYLVVIMGQTFIILAAKYLNSTKGFDFSTQNLKIFIYSDAKEKKLKNQIVFYKKYVKVNSPTEYCKRKKNFELNKNKIQKTNKNFRLLLKSSGFNFSPTKRHLITCSFPTSSPNLTLFRKRI